MANPQIEEGHTKIANDIMDALISAELSGQEFRISLLVMRKTYGFNKSEDVISLSQMVKCTGISKVRCSQVVNRLQLMKILTVTENINGIVKKYKFNKDFDKWGTVTKKCNRYSFYKDTVNVLINGPLMKSETTKDNITKDNITKDRGQITFRKTEMSDDEWLTGLSKNPAYIWLDVNSLYHKMLVWCETNGKKPTRRRFVNWLNREERPLQGSNGNGKTIGTGKGVTI